MTFRQEHSSWTSPNPLPTSPPPSIGSHTPSTTKLPLLPSSRNPTIITFLRHCGCPFAEKTFLNLRNTASKHPEISFIAVSHSDQDSTKRWIDSVGGAGQVKIIVDAEREVYSKWGLGVSGWGHVLSPGGLWSVWRLGRDEGIWNRPTESGSRWQRGGSWAVDGDGVVRWGGVSERADEVPSFLEAVEALKKGEKDSEGV